MNRILLIIVEVCLIPTIVFSQNKGYEFPNSYPSEYLKDPIDVYQKMVENTPEGVKGKHYKKFAEMTSFAKYDMLTEGHVYLGWTELELYLNQVLNKIAPTSLKNKEHIHVYPAYMPNFNAFALHDGTMLVNIGLLAQMEDEAGLAIIIGHELAHYYHQDVFNSYKELMNMKKSKRNKTSKYFKLNHAHSSREKEAKADELGYKWAFDAGYDLNSGVTNYAKMLLKEKEHEDGQEHHEVENVVSNKGKEIDLYSTHPLTEDRILNLKKIISNYDQKGASQYLVDKEMFHTLQKEAILESMRVAQEQLQFSLSIKLAYKELALNPNNQQVLYYLLEGIRKASFTKSAYLDLDFLSDVYYSLKKSKLKNDPYLIFKDSLIVNHIKIEELKDTIRDFDTYSEAFQFFENMYSDKISNPEVYLTLALFYHGKEISKASEYLEKYLSFTNAKYKTYAKNMKDNTLYSSLQSNINTLLLIGDIAYIEDRFSGYRLNHFKGIENRATVFSDLKDYVEKEFRNTSIYDLTAESIKNPNQYQEWNRLVINSMALKTNSSFRLDDLSTKKDKSKRDEKVNIDKREGETIYFDFLEKKKPISIEGIDTANYDLFYFSPESWDYFNNHNLKAVSYLDIYSINRVNDYIWKVAVLPVYFFYKLRMLPNYSSGSERYAYLLAYYNFDINKEGKQYSEEVVSYKMTKNNLLNTIYHVLYEK